MRKEKGFTLIELLAVIVILAILLGIAIPAVSNYTTNSRKKSFISSARMYLDEARKKAVINGLPQDRYEQHVIKVSELNMEKDLEKSPYGNSWMDEKSYVVIKNIGDNSEQKYTYAIALQDNQGHCIDLTLEDDLNQSEVKRNQCNIQDADEFGVTAAIEIERLAATNPNELMTDANGNLHYYGATPNNYVTFNGEIAGWRLLGVYRVDGEKRIKLVRNTPIGNYCWDNRNRTTGVSTDYGSNDWTTARIMKLLNPGFEEETVGGSLYWNSGKGDCYVDQNNQTTPCNFESIGLTSEARSMIAYSTFNIGGHSTGNVTPSDMAEFEKDKIWRGYVGLLTASDYGYASNLSICTKTLWDYNTDTNCTSTNYLFDSSYYEWLLPYNIGYTYRVFLRAGTGGIYNGKYNRAYGTNGIRPVVYLDSSVIITGDGDGSSTNPFTLSY